MTPAATKVERTELSHGGDAAFYPAVASDQVPVNIGGLRIIRIYRGWV